VLRYARPRCVVSRLLAAAAIVAALSCRPAAAAITLSEEFDGGSLNVPLSPVTGATVTLDPRKTSPGTYGPNWWWALYFQADGVQGVKPAFNIPSPLAGLKPGHRLVYSYDNANWQYFDNGSISGSVYYFSNNAVFTQNRVYVAIMLPYPVSKTTSFVASVKSSPYVFPTATGDANLVLGHTLGTAGGGYIDDMGRPVPSLPIYGFEVTDRSITGAKTKIVLESGNHSSESLSQYVLEGIVNWLIGPSPEAAALRRIADVYVYPSSDPEGRYSGYYVSSPCNPNGNHNRVWFDTSLNPELTILENSMRTDTGGAVTYFLDMHVDWNDSMMYATDAMLASPFYQALKLRDPAYCSSDYPMNPMTEGYAQSWAQLPTAQGGLAAVYASTPEFGQIYNNTEDFQHQRGANFGLAFYDALGAQGLAPTASAGPDAKVMMPNALTLAGSISDDGLPNPPGVCTAAWSVVSGPGAVTFAPPTAATTKATFAAAGTYVLRLTANDSAFAATSNVTVTVLGAGDFNGDGKVDGVDFLIWQANYHG
jgi:hypothetical protein